MMGRQFAYSPLKEEARKINDLLEEAIRNPGGELAGNLRDLGLGSLLDDTELTIINGQQRLKNPFEIRALGLNFDREGSLRDKLRQSGFMSEIDGVERIMGIAVGDEESTSFLEYGRTGQRLTENQIATLKSLMGNEILQDTVVEANIANPQKMAEKIGKLTKRQKSFSSPRQVSISGRGIANFLGMNSNQPFDEGTFSNSIHLFQPQAELLAARFGISDSIVSTALDGPRCPWTSSFLRGRKYIRRKQIFNRLCDGWHEHIRRSNS